MSVISIVYFVTFYTNIANCQLSRTYRGRKGVGVGWGDSKLVMLTNMGVHAEKKAINKTILIGMGWELTV